MISEKFVTPVETGVQFFYKHPEKLDSGLRRNDEKIHFQTINESINR